MKTFIIAFHPGTSIGMVFLKGYESHIEGTEVYSIEAEEYDARTLKDLMPVWCGFMVTDSSVYID